MRLGADPHTAVFIAHAGRTRREAAFRQAPYGTMKRQRKVGTKLNKPSLAGVVLALSILWGCSGSVEKPLETEKRSETVAYLALTFQGESEHWEATYHYNSRSIRSEQRYEHKSKGKITLRYKGSDAKSVGNVKFWFQTSIDGLGGTQELQENGMIVLEGGDATIFTPSGYAPILPKDSVVKATVSWNEKSVMIDLVSSKENNRPRKAAFSCFPYLDFDSEASGSNGSIPRAYLGRITSSGGFCTGNTTTMTAEEVNGIRSSKVDSEMNLVRGILKPNKTTFHNIITVNL